MTSISHLDIPNAMPLKLVFSELLSSFVANDQFATQYFASESEQLLSSKTFLLVAL